MIKRNKSRLRCLGKAATSLICISSIDTRRSNFLEIDRQNKAHSAFTFQSFQSKYTLKIQKKEIQSKKGKCQRFWLKKIRIKAQAGKRLLLAQASSSSSSSFFFFLLLLLSSSSSSSSSSSTNRAVLVSLFSCSTHQNKNRRMGGAARGPPI